MAGRPNEQREMRLVTEWLQLTYPDAAYQVRVRLGSLPLNLGTQDTDTPEARLVHNAFARWADAVVFLQDRTLIVEAKLVAHPVALSQLELYLRLVRSSPFLNLREGVPIEPVLLYAVEDVLVSQLAREKGITLVQYYPAWVDESLQAMSRRKRVGVAPQELAPAT
jgi:hypothetical protein